MRAGMPPAGGGAVIALRTTVIGLLVAGAIAGQAHAGAPSPGAAALPPGDGAIYGAAFAAAKAGKRATALTLAAKGGDPLAAKVIDWLVLSRAAPLPRFAELADFIENNPDWPSLDELRRRAAAAIDGAVSDQRIFAWFAANPPLTGLGRLRLAEAHLRAGNAETATTLLRAAWVGGDFTRDEEQAFLARHKKRLRREDHVARLDRLLWDGRRSAARRMLRRVEAGQRALGTARIRLMSGAGGVDAAIDRVPASLRDHPGLLFERLRWRRRHQLSASAREILAAPPDDLVRPAAWWRESHIQSRRAVQEGLISIAYVLASEHRQTAALPRSQAEWLAGWIALRFLADPGRAYAHFTTLHDGVSYSISVARAAYWAGRAAAAAGNQSTARAWYEWAAEHTTTYYGQLALAALDARQPLALPEAPAVSEEDAAFVNGHVLTRVMRLFADAGERKLMRPFVLRLLDLAGSPGRRGSVAAMAVAVGRTDLGLVVARRLAREGLILTAQGYPLAPLPPDRGQPGTIEPALVFAIMRQESGFDGKAVSGAGARGLMQLMPRTAHAVARRLNLPYSTSRLTTDHVYNLTLGRAYVGDLIERYDGSYVLALAAYNAGPGRVRSWIRDYGDPRRGRIDIIDWIELIPLPETRNYVQRVLEAVTVYRRVLGQPAPAHSLALDLKRGVKVPPS